MLLRSKSAVLGRLAPWVLLVGFGCSDPTPPETVGSVEIVSGTDGQSAIVGRPVPNPPAVLVKSTQGRPLEGVVVTFAVASGGGTVTPGTATTNASGIAAVNAWTLGTTAGENRLTATPAAGTAIAFVATGTPDAPAQTEKIGDGQTAPAGTALPVAAGVLITDQHGNPVPTANVTFAVTAGGGTIQGATTTTNAAGEAKLTSWTLGAQVGTNTVRATIAPLPPITLTAQGVAGPPTTLAPIGDNQQGTVNTAVAVLPGVTVTDQFSNPVAGVAVTFAVAAGGGTITGPTATTDAAGVARVGSWTLGTAVGQNRLTATAGSSSITLNATAVAGAPGKLVLVSGGQQTDTVLATLANPFVVRVTDAFDNPLAGVFVAYSVTAGGGKLTGVSATSTALGLTEARLTLGAAPGANTVRAALQAGSVTPLDITVTAESPPFLASNVAAGASHACAKRAGTGGAVYCWGSNAGGQLGNGTIAASMVPVQVTASANLTGLVAGTDFTCALDQLARAFCWGRNDKGQIGDGTSFDRATPVAVSGSFVYQRLFADGATACGLMVTGDLRCWGDNQSGTLGNGTTTPSSTPGLVSGNHNFRTVGLGAHHACGITTGGVTYCWGANPNGEVGDSTIQPRLVPTQIFGSATFTVIGAGEEHTCAATSAGQVSCWGKNSAGELGQPATTTGSLAPLVAQFAPAFTELVTRGRGNCGWGGAGQPVQCWGFNGDGQLNIPATATPHLPVPIQAAGSVTFGAVRLAPTFGCAIGSDGALYCWGANTAGQLGNGTNVSSLTPVRVRGR